MAETKKIYFVSDAHLGSKAMPEARANEKKLVAWIDSIQDSCAALYMMGDMIDFWYEYRRLVPKGFVRFFGKLAELTDRGIPVFWFAGNHDVWLYDYVQTELGVEVIHQPCRCVLLGKTFFMGHGDGLGDDSFGMKFLSHLFRNRLAQWLFSNVMPPELGMRLGYAWSKHSFEKRKQQHTFYRGEDREYLVRFVKQDMAAHPEEAPDFYVFGHRHLVLDLQLANDRQSRLIILGDWVKEFSYGVFDGETFYLDFFQA